jgi:ribosomal protein S19
MQSSLRINLKKHRSKGFKGKYVKLLEKLRNSKKNLGPGEKPNMIKTHLRNCVVVPEMIGSIVGVYTGKGKPPSPLQKSNQK